MKKFLQILTMREPTPLEQASAELEAARRDLLTHAALAELYAAHVQMLEARIRRLQDAVAELSSGEAA